MSRVALAALAAAALAQTAAAGQEVPQPLAIPKLQSGSLAIQPTLKAETAVFAQGNSWYGRSTANLGSNSDRWVEAYVKPGFKLAAGLDGAGRIDGELDLVGALTHGTDAAGTNVGDETPTDVSINQAWLGWNSAELLTEGLGADAVALSFGRQDFKLGNGFLFWQGSTNGGDRGAYWLTPRLAYQAAGIAKLETHGVTAQAFFLEPDDVPDTGTRLAGLDVAYALAESGCAVDNFEIVPSCLALGFYNVFDSELATRDGMSVIDLRGDARPLAALPGLRLAGELAYERNGDDLEAHGWYGEIGYAADDLPWSPYLSYRYAYFSGGATASGKSQNFDPLFYSGPDWGTWTQGEIIGEFVLENSNLVSHTVRLNAYPTRGLTLTALYYYFLLDDPGAAGVEDHDFAHEIDLAVDVDLGGNLSIGAVAAVSIPEDAAKQLTGGDQTWSQLLAFAKVVF
ncbi:MAG: alginate export family protein [Geminicoccaceae bacterium]